MTNENNFVPNLEDDRSFGRFEFTSLEEVRNRLINLTRSNRLINFQESRALTLADVNLLELVKKFSSSKEYSIQLFPRLKFKDFVAYLDWLQANPERLHVYGIVNGEIAERERFVWLHPQLNADLNKNKYARENVLAAMVASSERVASSESEQSTSNSATTNQGLVQLADANQDQNLPSQSQSVQQTENNLVTKQISLHELDKVFAGEDAIELSVEEQEFADLDHDEALENEESLASETGNSRNSLLPYLQGEPLTPEVIMPLLLTNSEARETYLRNRDYDALIPEILEKSINLASYASFALSLESSELGIEESKNPNFALAKTNLLQALAWESKGLKQLENFSSNNQKSIKEIGAGILYLTIGLVEYLDAEKTNSFAPLYLIPVSITYRNSSRRTQVVLSYTGEDIIENVSFAEKLKKDFNVYLPKINIKENLLQEKERVNQGLASIFSLEELEVQLSKVKNDDTYDFKDYFNLVKDCLTKQKFTFALHEQAFLATYQFAKQRMYLDLNPDEWPQHAKLEQHELINQLFNENTGNKELAVGVENTEYEIDKIEHIHDIYPLVAEADSSQHSALIDVIQGKNLVIEGPPGSGKSQTITNMIAAAMKQGKKVLFIAEKFAALEGVHRRLIDLGLGDFCLDLHDNHIAKKEVFESIAQRLDTLGKYTYPEGLPNAIAQYEQYKEKLNAYAEQISTPYLDSGFNYQEILAAAGYYKQFNFVNGGFGLFAKETVEDQNLASKFFTRDNYNNIIVELNSFTTIISKLRIALIQQARYLRQTQQEQDPIMAIVAKADELARHEQPQLINNFKRNNSINPNDPKYSDLRICDHLWYGVTSQELNSFDASRVIQSLHQWQKSLIEIKDFVQNLLRQHQMDPSVLVSSGELPPSGAEAQDLELAHLDLLALDIFAQSFASLPLENVSEFIDLPLLRQLLSNPLDVASLFNNLQHDLEHLERYLSFGASQGQGLFNYNYFESIIAQKEASQGEVDFSAVNLIPELRNKHYSNIERQRLLANREIERLFTHVIKHLPLLSEYIRDSGNLTQLNNFVVSVEKYLKRDGENLKSATEFVNYLTTKVAGTFELNYQQLVELANLLSELPSHLVKYRNINYLSPILETNFEELTESLNQLRYEIASLQMDFDLGHLASYEEFVEMRKALINKPNFFMRFFDSRYKNARRRLLLLTRGVDYDDIAVERILARIDSYYAKLRLLENSQIFKDFFGDLYQGADTNLDNIRILCDWSNKVVDYCRNELNNSQISPVLGYLLDEKEFFAIVEIGRTIANDFNRLREAAEEVNSYLYMPVLDYSQLSNLLELLIPEVKIVSRLVRTNYKAVDLQIILQDGIALFHEQVNREKRFTSGLISDQDLEQMLSYDVALSDLHSYIVSSTTNPNLRQRLFQEKPRLMYVANTWYIAHQFIGLSRLLGELKASNMRAIAGNLEQVTDLQKTSQVGLNLKEVLRIARMQQSQNEKVASLNITSRGILAMFGAFNSFVDFIQAQSQMAELSNSIKNARAWFADFIALTKLNDSLWIGESTNSLLDLIVRNQLALDCADGLIEWIDYLKATQSLKDLGIEKISHYAEQISNLNVDQLANMFSQVFFNYLAWKVVERAPILRDFSSISHNATIEKFDLADENLKVLQRQNIAFAIDSNTQVIPGVEAKRASELTEMALLRYVANHKNMRASLRDIIFRAGNSLQAIKPCFMMSPASVAQFLTPGLLDFDIMIMDEASQVTPEDALGAIARSKQVVIVGDPKQLPPTSFFASANNSSKDDESLLITQTAKSILDVATTMFPTRVLRWHYRSRHESLIAFSNQQYYGSKLVTFPSPYAQHPDYGVQFNQVEGTFDYKRGNPIEAKIVARAMITHLEEHANETLGVVAMNQRQATLVKREFDKLLEQHPQAFATYQTYENTVEPVFIKNLENVQGDERDVIIISCTYAPPKVGARLPQRFGPINGAAGSKRLNVLFTRSKKRMELYSSFTYQDVEKRSEANNSGVNDLRLFLQYAQTGVLEKEQTPQVERKLSTADYIANTLSSRLDQRYNLVTNLGTSSYSLEMAFARKGDNSYILGLETDGQVYTSAKSARDRDRLRQMVMRRLGWKLERVWTVDWYKYSQEEIIADLQNMLAQQN
ncbi:hypothetical protein CKF54_02520 [Psittacicella hinzii]|uniref:DNA helicase n=1 Tax=Psittacicella hinzii TaxID=2028575 RepID=A0A3A1Y5S2_9GAMM|nr:AAA domain-containing protein [Psittacicella hinzii]RIY33613.1 hypothetical protein CKF54_02520 [Psittacicella hinzii]